MIHFNVFLTLLRLTYSFHLKMIEMFIFYVFALRKKLLDRYSEYYILFEPNDERINLRVLFQWHPY